MIHGWLVDHRGKYVVLIGLLTMVMAWLGRIELANPISDQLMPIRLHILAVLLGATTAPLALRSQVASRLWVDISAHFRLMWFLVIVVLGCALTAVARLPGDATLAGRIYVVGALWGVSTIVALLWGEAAGLLCIFAVFAAYVVTPQEGTRNLWSPLAVVGCPPILGWAGGLAIAIACVLYVSNAFGRRKF